MKTIRLLFVSIAALTFAFTGCKKSEGVDTQPLEKSFASAEPAAKSSSDKAVAAIKAGNYSEGMAELGKLAQQAKLTPEQQQAVKDTLEQVKKQLAATMEKAGDQVNKAAGDLQKALPGSK
jgi:hypothetical protein